MDHQQKEAAREAARKEAQKVRDEQRRRAAEDDLPIVWTGREYAVGDEVTDGVVDRDAAWRIAVAAGFTNGALLEDLAKFNPERARRFQLIGWIAAEDRAEEREAALARQLAEARAAKATVQSAMEREAPGLRDMIKGGSEVH